MVAPSLPMRSARTTRARGSDEAGSSLPWPNGDEAVELLGQVDGGAGDGHGALDGEVGRARQGGGVGEAVVEEFVELRQPGGVQAEAGRHGVAAAGDQHAVLAGGRSRRGRDRRRRPTGRCRLTTPSAMAATRRGG